MWMIVYTRTILWKGNSTHWKKERKIPILAAHTKLHNVNDCIHTHNIMTRKQHTLKKRTKHTNIDSAHQTTQCEWLYTHAQYYDKETAHIEKKNEKYQYWQCTPNYTMWMILYTRTILWKGNSTHWKKERTIPILTAHTKLHNVNDFIHTHNIWQGNSTPWKKERNIPILAAYTKPTD